MLNSKKKVLIFIDWFTPAYKAGGPIKSITAIVNLLSDSFDFFIVTSNTDLNEQAPLVGITSNVWNQKERFKIIYLTPDKQNSQQFEIIWSEIKPEIIYFNSVFSVKFTLKPLLFFKKKKCEIIVAPRGMLGEGALKLKLFKKKIFLFIARLKGMFSNVTWHVSSEQEKREVINVFGSSSKIYVAPNLSFYNKISFDKAPKEKNHLNLFFISRISPKKNLEYAIDILAKVNGTISINYDIFGPIEDEDYWRIIESKIKKLPSNIIVTYKGALLSNKVSETIYNYDALFFPTLHENYGHVIIESLGAGCPVILSDNTPWKSLESYNIGYDIPLTKPDLFVISIIELAKLDSASFERKVKSCFDYAEKISNSEEVLKLNHNLFLEN